jgi:NADH:flavin oxidoreductases, Old Yellow Enzyme family
MYGFLIKSPLTAIKWWKLRKLDTCCRFIADEYVNNPGIVTREMKSKTFECKKLASHIFQIHSIGLVINSLDPVVMMKLASLPSAEEHDLFLAGACTREECDKIVQKFAQCAQINAVQLIKETFKNITSRTS